MTQRNKIKTILDNYVPSVIEEQVLSYWKENKIFEKSVENRSTDNPYSFYDGPPFITGLPHYGHLLGSIVKDVIPRYQTMKGKRVRRVWGWDCHGLPAENKVEKQLGINSKKEIEQLGVGKFVEACKDYVNNVSAEWEWYVEHIGRWVDFKHAYRTMDLSYMESVMWVFKTLYDKDLVYKGKRVSLFCPRCSTPLTNFEIAMDNSYKDVDDPSVFIKFKLVESGEILLAWTTTPWTLPTNFALGVDTDKPYVKVDSDGDVFILAKSRLEAVFKDKKYQILKEIKGEELVGKKYHPLYDYFQSQLQDHTVYAADFVSMEDGTGIVHIAPGFGEDDTLLGQKYKLSMIDSVDDEGRLDPKIAVGGGMFFKKADKYIIEDLQSKNVFFKVEKINHSYPHCYRCDTPLLYKAQDAWYLKVSQIKDKMYASNEVINWIPQYFKHGRFKLGIDSAPDWCISRSRYWGSPMPIWECECGQRLVFGSIKELEEASGVEIKDLHKPFIDEILVSCTKCGKRAKRIKEVLDCWVESASMPYAEIHYPFENKSAFEKSFPADFITEYTGQLRAWFYVMHVISNALYGKESFKNCIVTGVIQGNDGRKMSKNYGNYPDPKDSLIKYGADSLRMYLMGSQIVVGQDVAISESDWSDYLRSVVLILFNSYKFFVSYANLEEFEYDGQFHSSNNVLDRWIVARLKETAQNVDENLGSYNLPPLVLALKQFINDLSTWYIRRSRDRVGLEAYQTMAWIFENLFKIMAPLTPFISDYLYKHLTNNESVHLTDWPQLSKLDQDETKLIEDMKRIRKLVEAGLAARKTANIKVRQPLRTVRFNSQFTIDNDQLIQLIKDELNIKNIEFDMNQEQPAVLDTELDDELIEEGKLRELVRAVQDARKEAGARLDQHIKLVVPQLPTVPEMLDSLKRQVLADEVVVGPTLKVELVK
jgi:isoleucyl-tRNA synthetase